MTQADPSKPTPKAVYAPSHPPGPAPKRRKVGHVKTAAALLLKEGRKILKKYGGRIAAAPADAIRHSLEQLEVHRQAGAWDRLEDECERLDELLHQHASFARKSPVRETVENIAIAVLVALALRSCLYEPFKIPSGSMMPTLRSGDHIFVNKFAYGIQIPFTTTVVGGFMGAPKRGDVIVFRYPVDESEDFIKRVIGLPGDTVRVEGNKVSVKREGDAEFEELARTKLDEKCLDEAGESPVPHCTLYEETIDGHTYVVRYMSSPDPRLGGQRRFGEWKVPAEHFLVMGDNRNQSHDSLAWTRQVEAVTADGLLGVKDLRDLTTEKLFTLSRPDEATAREDSSHDHVVYMADHASDGLGLQLDVWRDPVLGHEVVYEALVDQLAAQPATATGTELKRSTLDAMWEGDARLASPANKGRAERLRKVGQGIREVAYRHDDVAHEAVVHLRDARAVLLLRCGVAVCRGDGMLADRIGDVVERFDRNHDEDARQLIEGDKEIRYSQHWISRGPRADKFVERWYQAPGSKAEPSPANTVRLRAWRAPDEDEALLRDAALRAVGSARVASGTLTAAKQVLDESGAEAWLARDDQRFTYVRHDVAAQVVYVLECGKARCAAEADALALARAVQARVPAASKDRSRLPELLVSGDLPGWREIKPATPPERDEYDRMRLDGSLRDAAYSVDIKVWRKPAEGLAARQAALVAELPGATPDEGLAPGAMSAPAPVGTGTQFVFTVPGTETVVALQCSAGLCPGPDEARALAGRAFTKAQDAGNFVDPNAERPRPYVPRGNVKGRAERIWLPLPRFWLPVR